MEELKPLPPITGDQYHGHLNREYFGASRPWFLFGIEACLLRQQAESMSDVDKPAALANFLGARGLTLILDNGES